MERPLLSAVVSIVATRDAELPASLGRAAHALLLKLVAAVDSNIAERLHETAPVKATTAAFVEEGANAGLARTKCQDGRQYHLRFTSLDGEISTLLVERVFKNLPEAVDLGGCPFRPERVMTETQDHPLAGQDDYNAIAARHLLDPVPSARLRLVFRSPTTFRSQGRHVPLPLPDMVFGSLLTRWNAFAPVRLDEKLRGWVGESLAISRFRLETHPAMLGGGTQIGFVGECQYTALNADPHMLRQLHALAAFAFYAGVGHKTTMGLGQTKVVTPRVARPSQSSSSEQPGLTSTVPVSGADREE